MSSNLARGRSGLPVTASQRILVTGGAGFIGSHLCRRLIAQGHDVLAVDNFYSSTRHNVVDLLDEPRFELMRYDVTFPLYVEVDQIYHLACPASPIFYQRDPVQTTKTCVHGSINMLGLAKRLRSPILLASTSEIYGDPLTHPQSESYWGNVNPTGIRACYDEGKRCAETLFFDYYRQHMLAIKVARIFNTYGPNMLPNDGRVVSSFMVPRLSQFYAVAISAGLVPGSGAGVEDEGLVDPLFRRPGRACEGGGELVFAVLAGAGLVDPDGPVVGGALVAQAQDRGGLAVAGQQRGDVAVLPAVADEGLAEAGPAGRDVGGDPPGDGVAGLLVWHLRHAVHDGRRGWRRPCPLPVMK